MDMKNVEYIGGSTERILNSDDMLTLGVDDHPGLWFTQDTLVQELEDDVAECVLSLRAEFAVHIPVETEEELSDKTKDELLEAAKGLEIPGTSKMTKDELVDAILEAQPPVATQLPAEGDEPYVTIEPDS
jgi:Rho termination factor, N-terminal domain